MKITDWRENKENQTSKPTPKGSEASTPSEKERKTPKKHSKGSKNATIKIDREEILEYPQDQLPADAEFKGYEQVIVQDISLATDNILFCKQKYYSPSVGKTYVAELPLGYEGEFGPGIKALMISLYYGGNMTQGKLLNFLADLGTSISAGYLSNLLIKNHSGFETEKKEVYDSGLASSLRATFRPNWCACRWGKPYHQCHLQPFIYSLFYDS